MLFALVIDPLELGDLVKVGRGYQSYGADRLSQPLPEASDYVAGMTDRYAIVSPYCSRLVRKINHYLKSVQPRGTKSSEYRDIA